MYVFRELLLYVRISSCAIFVTKFVMYVLRDVISF